MCKHEKILLSACKQPFECKAGSIQLCHCSSVALTQTERAWISRQYTGCLCAGCLVLLKERTLT
ncbi:cysteine-rich CWC family protein [Niabella hibiscisoli]|uniref:cysteine-rich CWC family protein n=1 Tax=Niabella hibiscisoli TaxID=1825928 RepID=UPI001F114AB3|nr:cysteine-rich CWC family protein [Niabella hibiscisoli]MCH5718582.1 cysteine-rich CWC family protein [Niabella hibiscisoli]